MGREFVALLMWITLESWEQFIVVAAESSKIISKALDCFNSGRILWVEVANVLVMFKDFKYEVSTFCMVICSVIIKACLSFRRLGSIG